MQNENRKRAGLQPLLQNVTGKTAAVEVAQQDTSKVQHLLDSAQGIYMFYDRAGNGRPVCTSMQACTCCTCSIAPHTSLALVLQYSCTSAAKCTKMNHL